MSAPDLTALRNSQEPLDALPIRSPMTGTILESHAIAGAAVTVGAAIFTVADLTELDVVAEIPESSLPLVRIGQRATIEVPAYPGVRVSGVVERLHDVLNPETRSVRAVLAGSQRSRAIASAWPRAARAAGSSCASTASSCWFAKSLLSGLPPAMRRSAA